MDGYTGPVGSSSDGANKMIFNICCPIAVVRLVDVREGTNRW